MTDFASHGWRTAGSCASADPELFFPVAGNQKAAARACRICAGCPVRRQCLEFAVETGETEGIWGGTTPAERVRARAAPMAKR